MYVLTYAMIILFAKLLPMVFQWAILKQQFMKNVIFSENQAEAVNTPTEWLFNSLSNTNESKVNFNIYAFVIW